MLLFPLSFLDLPSSKHPMLYAILIPDNPNRDIVYVNKEVFVIARRRTADYIVC